MTQENKALELAKLADRIAYLEIIIEAEREKVRKLVDLIKTYASYMKTANYHQMSDEMIMKLKEIEEA